MWRNILNEPRVFVSTAVVAVLGLLVLGVIDLLIMPSYTRYGEGLTVPDVTKMSLEQATTILTQNGLRLTVLDRRYNPAYPPDFIVDQNPGGGQLVKPNRMVYLTLNTDQTPKATVPDITNLSLRNAELQLKNYGLKIGNVSYASSKFKNVVLSQSVASGKLVDRDSYIDVVISDGLGESWYRTPGLKGLKLTDAQKMLTDRGMRIGIIQYQPSNDEINRILDFSVLDFTGKYSAAIPDSVLEGTTFNLTVSEASKTKESIESGLIIVDSTGTKPDSTRLQNKRR